MQKTGAASIMFDGWPPRRYRISMSLSINLLSGLFVIGAAVAKASASTASARTESTGLKKATFAGGCFWCMDPVFDGLPGIVSMRVGYIGGDTANPSYQEVCSGMTGHAEAIELVYDPKLVSYRKLLERFWHNIDPTVVDQQFCDEGSQYRTGIFFHDPEQEREARASKTELDETKPFEEPIVTEIVPASTFYPAEEYHQGYCKTNRISYGMYNYSCGRERRLRQIWGAAAGGH